MNKKILFGAVAVASVIAVAFFVMSDDSLQDTAGEITDDIYNYTKDNKEKKEAEEQKSLRVEQIEELTEEERKEIEETIENRIDEAMEDIIPRDGLDDVDDEEIELGEGNEEKFEEFSLEEIYGKEEVKEAKNIAENFLKQFHNYTGEEPDKYIKKSKQYMTNDFYLTSLEYLKVPLHSEFFSEFKSLTQHTSSYEPDPKDNIPLIYYVEGINKDPFGEETSETMDVYILELIKTKDGYKVGNVAINIPYY